MNAMDRLLDKVVAGPNGCWIFTGWKHRGYGRMRFKGRQAYAHRVSYELHVGPIAAGLEIDHLCSTPSCVRPDHLEAVTPEENQRRALTVAARKWVPRPPKPVPKLDWSNGPPWRRAAT